MKTSFAQTPNDMASILREGVEGEFRDAVGNERKLDCRARGGLGVFIRKQRYGFYSFESAQDRFP